MIPFPAIVEEGSRRARDYITRLERGDWPLLEINESTLAHPLGNSTEGNLAVVIDELTQNERQAEITTSAQLIPLPRDFNLNPGPLSPIEVQRENNTMDPQNENRRRNLLPEIGNIAQQHASASALLNQIGVWGVENITRNLAPDADIPATTCGAQISTTMYTLTRSTVTT